MASKALKKVAKGKAKVKVPFFAKNFFRSK
jgi:hypothetical protein